MQIDKYYNLGKLFKMHRSITGKGVLQVFEN